MTRFKTRLYHKASKKVYSTYMVQETDSEPMYWFKMDDNLIYATEDEVVVMNNIGDGKTFVGDIVSLTNINNWYVDKKTLGVVGYDKSKYCFIFVSMDGTTYPLSGKGVIVHGNIFDNPELIIIKTQMPNPYYGRYSTIRPGDVFSSVIINAFGYSDGNVLLPQLFKKIRICNRFVITETIVTPEQKKIDDYNLERARIHKHWNGVNEREILNERKRKLKRYKIYLEVKKEIEKT